MIIIQPPSPDRPKLRIAEPKDDFAEIPIIRAYNYRPEPSRRFSRAAAGQADVATGLAFGILVFAVICLVSLASWQLGLILGALAIIRAACR